MTDSDAIKTQMRALKLFTDFNDNEVSTFLELCELRVAAAGECIVRQDDPGDLMFVIIDGSAAVKHRAGEAEIELAKLGAGDFFGELALVDEGPRSADVKAITPCTLISISQGTIRALAGVAPSAAFKLLIAVGRVLVLRLRQGNRKYIDSLLAKSH